MEINIKAEWSMYHLQSSFVDSLQQFPNDTIQNSEVIHETSSRDPNDSAWAAKQRPVESKYLPQILLPQLS